jgi:hypothetical protein
VVKDVVHFRFGARKLAFQKLSTSCLSLSLRFYQPHLLDVFQNLLFTSSPQYHSSLPQIIQLAVVVHLRNGVERLLYPRL